MHHSGIGELLRRGGGRGGLQEFAETRTGIGKTPRGQFDMKRVQRVDDTISLFIGNHDLATRSIIIYGLGLPGQTDPLVAMKVSPCRTTAACPVRWKLWIRWYLDDGNR